MSEATKELETCWRKRRNGNAFIPFRLLLKRGRMLSSISTRIGELYSLVDLVWICG